jgi:hypothetical protein
MKKYFKFSMFMVMLMALCVDFSSCSKNNDEEEPTSVLEQEYFSVQNGVVHQGAIPAGTAASLGSVSLNHNALAGGSSFVSINSATAVSEIYIGVTGVNEYVSVPASGGGQQSAVAYAASAAVVNTFVLLFSQNLDQSFEIRIAARMSDGSITTVYTTQIALIAAGTGGLQVSLSFDNEKDVDLYVVEPNGNVVYYGDRGESRYDEATGQVVVAWGLDVDSNASCYIDGINNENVFYPREYIQSGTYQVWVNMYANCDNTIATNWVVTAVKEGTLINPTYGQNPRSGVFPVGTQSNPIGRTLNSQAIKVMEFTMQGTAQSSAAARVNSLDASAVLKLNKAAGK